MTWSKKVPKRYQLFFSIRLQDILDGIEKAEPVQKKRLIANAYLLSVALFFVCIFSSSLIKFLLFHKGLSDGFFYFFG